MNTSGASAVGPVIIIGAGQGGTQTAASLRENGYSGKISLLDLDPELPYQRPPLSKGYLVGGGQRALIDLRSRDYFVQHEIDLRVGVRAARIDRAAHRVCIDDGTALEYEHLVLATGATPRRLPVPGADLAGVHKLRTLADADGLRAELTRAPGRIIVVGGGFLGLEVAGVAAQLGHRVTVVEMQDQVMARVASAELASFVSSAHAAHGTEVLLGRCVREIQGQRGRATGIVLDDGTEMPADAVVVSVGVVPNAELASEAGLDVDDGVVVDEYLASTSCSYVSAIGDCSRFPSNYAGGRARLESVQNAVDQGRHVAGRIAGCHDAPYSAVPWFWSNQLDLRMQLVGISTPSDTCVVRGDLDCSRFSVFRFRDGRLQSIESVNRPSDHIGGRKLLGQGLRPSREELERNDFKLSPDLYS